MSAPIPPTAARAVGAALHRRNVLTRVGAMLLIGVTGAGPIALVLLIWATTAWRQMHDREGVWAADLYAAAGASRRQRRAVRARAGLIEAGGGTAAALLAVGVALAGPGSGWIWEFQGVQVGTLPGLPEERLAALVLVALALLLTSLVTSARIGPAAVRASSGESRAMPGFGAIVLRALIAAVLIWAAVTGLSALGELLGAGPWIAAGVLAAACAWQTLVLARGIRAAVVEG